MKTGNQQACTASSREAVNSFTARTTVYKPFPPAMSELY